MVYLRVELSVYDHHMTCVVGSTDGKTIILGADSAASGTDGEIYTTPEPKVFACGPYLFGVCGSYRLAQILRFRADLPEMPAGADVESFLVCELLPAIAATVDAEGITGTSRRYLGDKVALLLGIQGQLWGICSNLALIPETDFGALGSGRHRAYGALYALNVAGLESPHRRLEIALEAAAAYTSTVRPPWHFVSTESNADQPVMP